MKILITISYFQPKIGYAESKLAEQLSLQGHEVEVITSDHYFPFPDFESSVSAVLVSRKIASGRNNESGYWITRQPQIAEVFARSVVGGIETIVRNFKPDVVISFGVTAPATIQAAWFKKKYGYKLIAVDSHLPSEYERGNSFFKQVFYFTFRLIFSNFLKTAFDKIVALQEDTKIIISQVYGIKKSVTVIPHGSDLSEFRYDSSSRKKIRSSFKFGTKDLVVIYTGKVVPAKGGHILFEALNLLLRDKNKIYLIILGDGHNDYKQKCLNKLDSSFHKRVHWLGFQPQRELYKYYSAADVAIWPLQESLAMNDAAACRLPFIANDEIGARLRVSNNNALLYKKGISSDLAMKIAYLYSNPSKRKTMGKNGRHLIEEKLSWQKLAHEFIKEYYEK